MAESEISPKTNLIEDTKEPQKNNDDIFAKIKEGYAALMPTIRASNSLPKGQQWDLFCTSPLFRPIMDSLGEKALELMSLILKHQGINRDIRKRDLEEKYELLVETNDKILERVGINLDELAGIRRNPTQDGSDISFTQVSNASGSWNKNVSQSAAWKEVRISKSTELPVVLKSSRITERPQLKFHDKIDNRSLPFEPRIKEKPNALKPLAILLEDVPNEDACFSHPYEFELDRFQERIDKLNLERKVPQKPRPLDETPLIWVTSEDQLDELLQDLHNQTDFAVDLEHHSYRSFQGFTCLMQISTREKDYIVDTLVLRHKLYILNEVFTDPKIVKVFHGADSDITWLQRDFSLYVVNMFDTYQAALLLSLPRLSLAYLLKSFCNIDANKCFQLYDWRTRPLAKEAEKYAREDTHYLLYIYDMLWNKLLDQSKGGNHLLQSAIFRSADTCKKRYWKSIYKEDSYEAMYRQSKKNFDNRQLYALKELHVWRDRTARESDESIGYVLPNHMLLLIAETLPKEMQGILACCNPIPPLVRQNLVTLHQMILKAREQPLVIRMNSMGGEGRARPAQQTSVNIEGSLYCPHDLTHDNDFRDDLPTLLDDNHDSDGSNIALLEKVSSASHIFCESPESEGTVPSEDRRQCKINFPHHIHFLSPFERYKKMLLYLEEEESKTEEEKQKEIERDTQKLLDECMRERLKSSISDNSEQFSTETVLVKQENESQNKRKRERSEDSSPNDSFVSNLNVSIKSEKCLENTQNNSPKKKKTMVNDSMEILTPSDKIKNENCESQFTEQASLVNISSSSTPQISKKKNNKSGHNYYYGDPRKTYEIFKQSIQNETTSNNKIKTEDNESSSSDTIKNLDYSGKDKGKHERLGQNVLGKTSSNQKTHSEIEEDLCSPVMKRRKLEISDSESLKNTGAKKKQFSEKSVPREKSSEEFQPFDYSKVDYKQYQQSGASQAQRNPSNKFKHKGKKKQQNKMFTFQRQYGDQSGKKK